MPTYITLGNFTEQGITNIEEGPDRLDRAKEVTAEFGGEFKEFYLAFGEYDFVYIAEYPDDESAAKATLTVGRGGNVSTETLKAFPEDEYRDVVAAVSEW